MEFVLAQIFGIVALVLICIGYFLKKKSNFLIIQVVANLFYAASFLMLDAKAAGIITLISLVRCIYIYFAEKYNFKYIYHFLSVFFVFYVLATIFFWSTPFDFVPLITSTLFTIGFALKNMQQMKYVLIIPNVMLVVYNILTKTYTNALLDLLETVVLVVAIIKDAKENKKPIEK